MRVATGSPFDALIDSVPDHDAVVMGAAAPSLSSLLFGDAADRVAIASVGPVLVVRSEDTESNAGNDGQAQPRSISGEGLNPRGRDTHLVSDNACPDPDTGRWR